MLSFFPRGVLDEILNLIESVSGGFPSCSCRVFMEAILMSTHNIYHFQEDKEMNLNDPKSAGMGLFQGLQERVRNSRGIRAISVRVTEVLL